MNSQPDISVVVPVYNEIGNLGALHQRLSAVLEKIGTRGEMIFVDDGSRDGSRAFLRELQKRDPRVRALLFSRNFGHQAALSAGLDVAEGKAVVLIDADLQDPPELIEKMHRKWQEGYHVVYAVRKRRAGENVWKRASAYLFYRLLSAISGVKIPQDSGDFRLLDQEVVRAYRRLGEKTRYLRGITAWLGFRQVGVKYNRHARHAGHTHYSFPKMVRLGIDGILSFSRLPLRLSMYTGMFIGLIGICYTIYMIVRKLIGAYPVPGWASIMVAVLLLGSLNLIFMGVIGEYLSRVYLEVLGRPLYIVQERLGFDSGESDAPSPAAQ